MENSHGGVLLLVKLQNLTLLFGCFTRLNCTGSTISHNASQIFVTTNLAQVFINGIVKLVLTLCYHFIQLTQSM